MARAATAAGVASGQCLCGKVCFEIDVPARWAWHDHSLGSRRAHGAAYATYVGSWRKRFRITKGKTAITRYEDKATKTTRSFCAGCGTPIAYERARSPHMVNIPRALFSGRTGRQPLYHIAIEEYLSLAKHLCVHYGTQAAADQTLDLLCSARRTKCTWLHC